MSTTGTILPLTQPGCYASNEFPRALEIGDPVVFMKKATDWLGADCVIDAVGGEATGNAMQVITGKMLRLQAGSATAAHWAVNSVKKGGIMSVVGVYGPVDNLFPLGNVVNKGITIRAGQRHQHVGQHGKIPGVERDQGGVGGQGGSGNEHVGQFGPVAGTVLPPEKSGLGADVLVHQQHPRTGNQGFEPGALLAIPHPGK